MSALSIDTPEHPTNQVSSTEGAGDCANSPGSWITTVGGSITMGIVDESTPAAPTHDECPDCKMPAWLARNGVYHAMCGSSWEPGDTFKQTSAVCLYIETRNDRIEELEHALEAMRVRSVVAA